MKILFSFVLALVLSAGALFGQYPEAESSKFDFGKLWTFEYAPLDYFEQTYDFRPDAEWLEHARMAALKFSTYCSASFISPEGLLLTNYHCSEGELFKVQNEKEDLYANGFYAEKREDERRVPDLFVRQLARIQDVTAEVQAQLAQANPNQTRQEQLRAAYEKVIANYSGQPEWKGLEPEVVRYYYGNKYSLYGYKRYTDVRLVLIPELSLGLYGGDPDNFTYPRYSLDYTIWRVYENGQPVNSSEFYFPFNTDGITAGEPVFAISNPASTERYRTVAQLEFDREYRYNILLAMLRHRKEILEGIYAETQSDEVMSEINNFANSIKAINGIVQGLHTPELMGRKVDMEKKIQTQSGPGPWNDLAREMDQLKPHAPEMSILNPTPFNGAFVMVAHQVKDFLEMLEKEAPEADLEKMRAKIRQTAAQLSDPVEAAYLEAVLSELKEFSGNDAYVKELLDGRTPAEAVQYILDKTQFTDEKKLDKLLTDKTKKLEKGKDPVADMALLIVQPFRDARTAFRNAQTPMATHLEKIGGEIFKTYGLSIPPDATFTLRLCDGVVKNYEYNGTVAPIKTTFFGMYDRHFSNDGKKPWDLPERWVKNMDSELLETPLNFVTTADGIGGSSGSPLINRKGELVGLFFDGNIQSLPGNFIYEPTVARSVCVHPAAIVASMKHIYKAKDLMKELGVK